MSLILGIGAAWHRLDSTRAHLACELLSTLQKHARPVHIQTGNYRFVTLQGHGRRKPPIQLQMSTTCKEGSGVEGLGPMPGELDPKSGKATGVDCSARPERVKTRM